MEQLMKLAAMPESELNKAIAENPTWEALYHFSQLRVNILSPISFVGEEKVLLVGGECGALVGELCEKVSWLDVVESNPEFVKVMTKRWEDRKNLRIFEGGFSAFEEQLEDSYDVIFMFGDSFEEIEIITNKLNVGARLYFICENRFGLKYFAGCREDNSGELFRGLEGGIKGCYSLAEIKKRLDELELVINYKYYPYPDWKLPGTIFSEERLPMEGELWENERNFDGSRANLFDEQKVFDGIIEAGQFEVFSNSFMLELCWPRDKSFRDEKGRLIPGRRKTNCPMPKNERIIYCKASNDRAEKYRIYTDLIKTKEGTKEYKTYRKRPASEAAKYHLNEMSATYARLEKKTFGGNVVFNKCGMYKDGAHLEIVKGESLDKIAWESINDEEKLTEIFVSVKDSLDKVYDKCGFALVDEFRETFGDIPGYDSEDTRVDLGKVAKDLDCDLLLSNILVDGAMWTIIDYEWTFPFPVPVNFALYRCVKNFYIIHGIFDEEPAKKMMLKLGITEEQMPIFENMDNHMIREYVLRDYTNLSDLGQKLLKVSVGIPEIIEAAGKLKRKDEMIEELTTTLADTQKAVYELQNCTSMKITAPLRKIMAFFKDDSKEKHE